MGSPSDDTTTASFTPGTRSAKFCTSQLRFLASELSSHGCRLLSSGLASDRQRRWVEIGGHGLGSVLISNRHHHGLC